MDNDPYGFLPRAREQQHQVVAPDSGTRPRHSSELSAKMDREFLMWQFAVIIAASALAYLAFKADWILAITVLSGLGAVLCLAWEVAYRQGIQIIPGAMVLDRPPGALTAADVVAQKAHGEGRRATMNEVWGAIRRQSGSPLNDLEF